LAAARTLFAEKGYEGATVRDIAGAANIDPSMVIRYFGGKEALFAQAAELNLRLPDLKNVPEDRWGEALVRHFLAIWEGESGINGLPVALRSAASNELAAERLRGIFTDQVAPALAKVAAGGPSTTAGLVSSQLLGLAFCRYVLKLPPVVALSSEQIVVEVGRVIQGLLKPG
jgi:AcrR family transcriptional regulator